MTMFVKRIIMCVVFAVVTVGFCLLAVQAWADSPKVDIDIPYAGMSEKLISQTKLGKPTKSEYRVNYSWGKRDDYTIYIWSENGETYFTVEAKKGVVTFVQDNRESAIRIRRMKEAREAKQQKREHCDEDDPYEASSFANAEDFYDEYRDDFFDYEDAEEYWDEYGEW